jgi:hypothetical protein
MEELRDKIYRILADTLSPTEDPAEITREIMLILRQHALDELAALDQELGI